MTLSGKRTLPQYEIMFPKYSMKYKINMIYSVMITI